MSEPSIEKGKVVASIVKTRNLHLATLLGTIGCKPFKIVKGPDKTPNGDLVTSWTFESTPISDEAMALWNSIGAPKDWEQMNREERRMVINVVSAFAGNQRHFLKDTRN